LTAVSSSVARITNAAGFVKATALILANECTASTYYNTTVHKHIHPSVAVVRLHIVDYSIEVGYE